MNLPNKLTVLRVIMVPFFVFFMLTDVGGPANKWIALVLFCVASLTDMLDGKIARARNLVTNFGKFMDPVADKLLVMAALLIFVEDGTVPAWAVAVILGREFIVSSLRMVAASSGKVIAANRWGKAKTGFTMLTLIFLLLRLDPIVLTGSVTLQDLCIWITVALTAISGATYIIDNSHVVKDGFTQKGA